MIKISNIKLLLLIITANFIALTFNYAQSNNKENFIIITPEPNFKAGWLHELFFGKHWRDVWTTPVKVKILDLNTFAGGLTPIKKGGGFQTKSLRFKGNDGNIWKFRSINKDPSKILPEDLRNSLVNDIIQDQISSANPYAALVAVPIISAVGILQAKPQLVYLPDKLKLGKYRKEFGGLLGMIEIHPDYNKKEGRTFEGAEKIKSTFKLFRRLEEKRDEFYDAKGYLKARLIDILLGDWDRHTDQWKWARYTEKGMKLWEPIPRDRDQVFAKWDGIGPRIAEYIVPQFVGFDDDYPQIEDLTWSGRFIDRRILPVIDKHTWDSVTAYVKSKITDKVIEDAVKQLPSEIYPKISKELIYDLKKRRDNLDIVSNEYFKRINKYIDIFGTNKKDLAEVIRLNDSLTKVTLFKKKKNDKKGSIFFNRIFENQYTNEIRIYLLDGNDRAIVKGKVNEAPMVEIIGGKGKDELIDSSVVYYKSASLSNSIPSVETKFYDGGKKTKIILGKGTYFNSEKFPVRPKSDSERYEPQQRDRGHNWVVFPIFNYNTNDGLIAGGGPILYKYGFRKYPYDYRMLFTTEYATRPKSFNFNFLGLFNSVFDWAKVELKIQSIKVNFSQFYGFGNKTIFNNGLYRNNFYNIEQELFTFIPNLFIPLSKTITGKVELEYRYSHYQIKNPILLSNFTNGSYGIEHAKRLSLISGLIIDTRDVISNPALGYFINLEGKLAPRILDNKYTFAKASIDVRKYFTINTLTNTTFALRAGGEKVWGKFPFFESAFLGGGNNLLGYLRNRFAGDASIYGQVESKIYLTPLKFIIRGKFGIHLFANSGRVFAKNEDSSKWHSSFGGGVWMSFLDRTLNIILTTAYSKEKIIYYFSTAFSI